MSVLAVFSGDGAVARRLNGVVGIREITGGEMEQQIVYPFLRSVVCCLL